MGRFNDRGAVMPIKRWTMPEKEKLKMYESPINQLVSDISTQMIKKQEDHLMYEVRQSIGYDIDKDELLKALQYDRNQYNKGYNEGIFDYIEAITDTEFLKLNYGIADIDIHFITSFSPKKVIEDYTYYKHSTFCE